MKLAKTIGYAYLMCVPMVAGIAKLSDMRVKSRQSHLKESIVKGSAVAWDENAKDSLYVTRQSHVDVEAYYPYTEGLADRNVYFVNNCDGRGYSTIDNRSTTDPLVGFSKKTVDHLGL